MQSHIKHKLSRPKKVTIIIVVLIVLSALACAGMYIGKLGPFADKVNSNNSSSSYGNKSTTEPIKSEKTPINNQPSNEGNENSLSASITYINQTESSLRIGTVINEVTSDGTCELKMTQGDKELTDSVGLQALASSSTCQGFNIPLSSLDKGSWDIYIIISSNSKVSRLTERYTVN